MADDFNPYHVWLGIPPDEQPANHYRLLSLRLFESSADVIDNAADRQMAHLRTIQVGKHGELSQRLLNEVAAARVCLLDPKKRAAYDQQLRATLPATPAAALSTASGSAIQRQPPRRPGALPTAAAAPAPSAPMAAALPQPANDWDDLLGDPTAKPASRSAGRSAGANAGKASAAKRTANNRNLSIGIAAAVLLIAAVGIGWLALNGSSADGTLVFDLTPDERADTTLTVDNVPLSAPASGAWEYHGPAGSHHVVAQRPAYKLDANVALVAGQTQTIPADWKPKALLALNWPLALRSGAELKIDGRAHPVTQHDPLEIAVEPGRHLIQITRSGSAPVNATALVADDGRELVSIAAPPSTATNSTATNIPAGSAKIVFDWPADQRKDAELIIDGSKQGVPTGQDCASFALVVGPGRRIVQMTRRGFEPFKAEIDLAAGTNETVKPTWTAVQTVATTAAETPPPAETPTEQPAKKRAIPPAAEQEKIAKQFDDLFKSTPSGPKNSASAQELFDLSTKASSTERYVLLVKGAELAAAAGDLNLSLQGVDSLDAEFEIDALEATQKLLDKFVTAGKPDQVDAAIPIAEQFMDQAVAADRFALAIAFSATANRAATKSKIATRDEIDERLSRRRHEIHVLEPLYAAAKAAQETLAKNPADADANSNLGRWLCFYKGDWLAGLPLSAKGSNEPLKSLAEQELKTPTDAEQQAHLADAWWELASKESGTARDSINLHASDIYQTALPNLTSALRKAAIEKRLAEVADLRRPDAPATGSAGSGPDGARLHFGPWIDVLANADAPKDSLRGRWSRNGTNILCESDGVATFGLPTEIVGSYELEVEFTRRGRDGEVGTIFPIGPHYCIFLMNLDHGAASGLDNVAGHRPTDRANPAARRPGGIENGRRYRVLLRVRVFAEDRARIEAFVNGKQYLPRWEGNPSSLGTVGNWPLPPTNHAAIGGYNSFTTFHSVRLRSVNDSSSGGGSTALPPAKGFDLLAKADPDHDTITGHWTRQGSTIVSDDQVSAIVFPTEITEANYELRVNFSRDQGDDCFTVSFPVGDTGASFTLSTQGKTGKWSGLEMINGERADHRANPTGRSPSTLINRRRYAVRIVVTVQNGNAAIRCFLDDKELVAWKGKVDSLSQYREWKMPPHRAGVAAYRSPSMIYSALLLK